MLLLTLYRVPWLLSNCVMLTFSRVCTRHSAYTVLSTWMDIDNELIIILILASTKFMISNNKRQSISILKLLAFFLDVKNSLFNRVQLNK